MSEVAPFVLLGVLAELVVDAAAVGSGGAGGGAGTLAASVWPFYSRAIQAQVSMQAGPCARIVTYGSWCVIANLKERMEKPISLSVSRGGRRMRIMTYL